MKGEIYEIQSAKTCRIEVAGDIKTAYLQLDMQRLEYDIKRADRIVWECWYGFIPPGQVLMHENGDPLDNWIDNLRLVPLGLYMDE